MSWEENLEIKVDCEVPGMSYAVPLCAKMKQRPDLSIYSKNGKWITSNEVHSSRFDNTLRKAIIQ